MSVRPVRQALPVRRGLGLIRVSREREGMTSPDVQRHAIQEYAASRGIEIVGWVEGIDESGSKSKSAWWAKLDASVARMEAGEVDTIVVWKFSRTARHRLRWAVALDRVDTAGGSLESATEQTDATPSGRFARGMLGELNAYQAELIGETWREAHERRIREGLPPTGGHRFGYEQEPHAASCAGRECLRTRAHGPYRPDPVTGPALAECYQRYLRGEGFARITRYLNESGHTDGRERLTFSGLRTILDSGFAAGLLGRTITVGGRRKVPVPWEREYVDGAHEPIIDAETWAAYVAAREKRSGRQVGDRVSFMLAGLLRCGDCGGPMHSKVSAGKGIYVCSRASITTGLRSNSVNAERVEAVVEDWLFSFAADLDGRIAVSAKQAAKRDDAEFVLRRARARLEQADDRIATLTLKVADGTVSDSAYRAAVEAIEVDRAEAAALLRTSVPNPAEQAAPAAVPTDLAALWPTLDATERNLLLRPLVDHVLVPPSSRETRYSRTFQVVPRWEA